MASEPTPGSGAGGVAGNALRLLSILALLSYPFAVFYGLERFGPGIMAIILGALLVLRLAAGGLLRGSRRSLALMVVIATFVAATFLSADERVLKAYPVLINLGLLVMFALSLVYPPTVPERGMRLAGREVPEEAHNYLRGVTLAWCGFFLGNGLIAAWTALFAPTAWWALYNGFISYVLIGLFFAAEYGVRLWVKRQHATQADTHG